MGYACIDCGRAAQVGKAVYHSHHCEIAPGAAVRPAWPSDEQLAHLDKAMSDGDPNAASDAEVMLGLRRRDEAANKITICSPYRRGPYFVQSFETGRWVQYPEQWPTLQSAKKHAEQAVGVYRPSSVFRVISQADLARPEPRQATEPAPEGTTMTKPQGSLYMLRVEIDGHFHGSPKVPRPWVARLSGPDPKYGLAREFVQQMNNWESARRAGSGNLYGVVAHFPMRRGHLYQVSRLRGRPSKRYVAQEFGWLGDEGPLEQLEPEEVLDRVAGSDGQRVSMETSLDGSVGEVRGLGIPDSLPWIVRDEKRLYRLCETKVYAVEGRLVGVRDGGIVDLSQEEAWSWLK